MSKGIMNHKTRKILLYVWALVNLINVFLQDGIKMKLMWGLGTVIVLFLAITIKDDSFVEVDE